MSYWILAALVLWAAVIAMRRRQERKFDSSSQTPRRRSGLQEHSGRSDPDIDRATLEAAEREVQDLETDVRGRPLEDAVGDDWGPGTPKPPYV